MPYVRLATGRVHYAERGERRAGEPSALLHPRRGRRRRRSGRWSSRAWRATRTRWRSICPGTARARSATARSRSSATATPSGGLAAHALPRPVGAGRPLAGRAGGDRGGARLARQGPRAGALRRRAEDDRRPESSGCCATIPQAFVPWLADHALSPRAKPAFRQAFLAATAPTATEIADRRLRDRPRHRPRARGLADVACPITWLDGADDAIVPPAAARRPPRRGRDGPAAGHLLPIEAPRRRLRRSSSVDRRERSTTSAA